jgi:formate dehydrogenase subunit beta
MVVRKLVTVDALGPLYKVRGLLRQVWDHADLGGIFIMSWVDGQQLPVSTLITEPDQLQQADPFTPVMTTNAARSAFDLLQTETEKPIGLVLRPCELHSLRELAKRDDLDLSKHHLISADCLAVFPIEDYKWRLGEISSPEELTLGVLQFAAQGGILPSRYQRSCQLCEHPYPIDSDLQFELLGMPTSEYFVITTRDAQYAKRVGFENNQFEAVPPEVTERRDRIIEKLTTWRGRSLAYAQSHLADDQSSLTGLLQHLRICFECKQRIQEHCPLFLTSMPEDQALIRQSDAKDWLLSCGGCGMCEHQCPDSFPLFTVITHLRHQLSH